MKNLQVFWQLLRINLKKSLIYRINFLITVWAMFLWIFIYVVFFEVLFLHVNDLAGWDKAEMLTFLAFYYFIQSIGNVFYRESFEIFNEKLRYGYLDQSLTKPTSLQLLTFFYDIRFDHLVDFFLTGLLFFYIGIQTNLTLNVPFVFFGLALALFGNLLFYGLLLCVASVLFYVDRMDGVGSFMWHLSQIARYPRQIYTGFAKVLFQFIFPIALLTSIPAEVALGQGSFKLIGFFLGISILFFGIGNLLFWLGLQKYHSAS